MGIVAVVRFVVNHPFNEGARFAALGRLVRWQIGTRLLNAPVAMPFVNGTRLLVTRGMAGATGNIYVGLHEYADMAFVGHFLRPGDLFVDVGANVGAYSILAASCGASVVAYEPVSSTFVTLETNVKINGFERRISARRKGVGAAASTLTFTTAHDTVNHVAVDGETGETVGVVRLDDEGLAAECCVVKIDVEGFEMAVLDGAESLLGSGRVAAVVLELNGAGARYGVTDDVIDARMRALGYASHDYAVATRTLVPCTPHPEGNTLYVRDAAIAAERLRTASQLEVMGKRV